MDEGRMEWVPTPDLYREDSFIMPPESGQHVATILVFPSHCSMPKSLLQGSRSEIIAIASAVAYFESVRLYVRPEDLHEAQGLLDSTKTLSARRKYPIDCIVCPCNHPWARDNGPVYVFTRNLDVQTSNTSLHMERCAIDFGFNEWGGKVPTHDHGERGLWGQKWPVLTKESLLENKYLASWIASTDLTPSPTTIFRAPLTLEGGGLIVDGEGTLMITESCVICPDRNPGWSKSMITSELERLLGIRKIIWFKGCRGEDITDAHVDDLARFVMPGVVVVTRPLRDQDVWSKVMQDIRETLSQEVDAKGRSLQVIEIEEPALEFISGSSEDDPQASYANFYFVNGGLILPAFGDPERDLAAFKTMKHLLGDREVHQVQIHALPLSGGGIHCVTQQVPACPRGL